MKTNQHQWERLKSPEFKTLRATDAVVILPIGSTEQHGPHLPVGVDSMLVGNVAQRAALMQTPASPVVVLPTMSISLAEHHMAFGGTITLDHATFCGLLRCLVGSIGRQGFRRVLLLNGHGGNMAALVAVVDSLTRDLGIPIASASYWNIAAAEFGTILDGQTQLLHACEAETSMMMAIAPELVNFEAARCVSCDAKSFHDGGGVYRYRPIGEWSASGVVGTPHLSSAEKGERLLNAAATALARRLSDGSIWPKPPIKAQQQDLHVEQH